MSQDLRACAPGGVPGAAMLGRQRQWHHCRCSCCARRRVPEGVQLPSLALALVQPPASLHVTGTAAGLLSACTHGALLPAEQLAWSQGRGCAADTGKAAAQRLQRPLRWHATRRAVTLTRWSCSLRAPVRISWPARRTRPAARMQLCMHSASMSLARVSSLTGPIWQVEYFEAWIAWLHPPVAR
jgi:hypothetical protein